MNKNKTLGLYYHSIFYMVIDKQFNGVTVYDCPELIHEYVHYIQDLSTTYGLNKVNYLMKMITYYFYIAQNSEEIKVPVIDNSEYIIEVEDYFFLLDGDIELTKYEPDIKIISYDLTNHLFEKLKIEVCSCILKFSDNKTYNFGARTINEGMAYLIEKNFYNNRNAPIIPYHICVMLADYIYKDNNLSDLDILALCDVSLMYSHPHTTYICILNLMNQEKKHFSNSKEIYTYVLERVIFQENKDLMDLLTDSHKLAQDAFSCLFDEKDESYIWLSSVFSAALNLRKKSFSFILEYIENGNKIEFFQLFQILGTPLIFNSSNEAFEIRSTLLQERNPSILMAYFEIYRIFRGRYSEIKNRINICSLIEFCKNNSEYNVNSKCYVNPWERTISDELCPFSAVMSKRSINNKKIVITN